MIIPVELRFKADKDSKSVFQTGKTIKSHDVNSVEFQITIDGLELTSNHTAKVLSVFHSSESQVNVDCEIVEGKIIYKPDTKLISRHEHVTNYVYVYHNNQSLDVREFIYIVDLSKIDETSLEVKEVYDQSYADLLADFEQALEDYKLTLPQASELRAEIDVILNQFGVDSQAKLNQYDTDVQQVIADNQAAFDLAESERQESYEQTQSLINEAELSRVQAEGQRESSESSRVQAEIQRASEESNRVSAESSRVISEADRVLSEDERENAEAQRKTDHANRSAELDGKANKKQEDWITPTLLNGWVELSSIQPPGYMKDEFGFVHFRGCIKNGTAPLVFNLPVGYRTTVSRRFPVTSGDSTIQNITINGKTVEIRGNSSAYTYLDNVIFEARW